MSVLIIKIFKLNHSQNLNQGPKSGLNPGPSLDPDPKLV